MTGNNENVAHIPKEVTQSVVQSFSRSVYRSVGQSVGQFIVVSNTNYHIGSLMQLTSIKRFSLFLVLNMN